LQTSPRFGDTAKSGPVSLTTPKILPTIWFASYVSNFENPCAAACHWPWLAQAQSFCLVVNLGIVS
jgi:hypothetical protein